MKKQGFSAFLPGNEYIPDGEAHVFGDRVYLYGSHDKFDGISFCLNDYVCWSAPVNDLSDWRYEGVIFRKADDPKSTRWFVDALYAPDVCRGADGRYYLYYFLGYTSHIGVAVCDTPAGKYEFLSYVKYPDGALLGDMGEPLQFDPAVLRDDDGKVYLYTGFGRYKYPRIMMNGHRSSACGPMVTELEPDMVTVSNPPHYIGVRGKGDSAGTPYEGNEFFEASSIRKFEGKYYYIYRTYAEHELVYTVSNRPTGGFEYGGRIISIADVGIGGRTLQNAANYWGCVHGGIERIGGEYYVFYHRQTNRHQFSRQACAERIAFEGGKFKQAELTSCGLNGKPLAGAGRYEARIVCGLQSARGVYRYGCAVFKHRKGKHPYLTQTGRDGDENAEQYIANFTSGSRATYKYFSLGKAKSISVNLSGKARGVLSVGDGKKTFAKIVVRSGKERRNFTANFECGEGTFPLVFTYYGKGRLNFFAFELIE